MNEQEYLESQKRYRRTGRTTRMLEAAVSRFLANESVCIVAASLDSAHQLRLQLKEILAQRGVPLGETRVLDDTVRVRGMNNYLLVTPITWKHPLDCECKELHRGYHLNDGCLFVDHYAIENEMGPWRLFHLRRFEEKRGGGQEMSKPCCCEACKDKTRGYAIVLFRRSDVDTYYCAQGYRTMASAIKCMQRWNSTFPGDAFIKVIKL